MRRYGRFEYLQNILTEGFEPGEGIQVLFGVKTVHKELFWFRTIHSRFYECVLIEWHDYVYSRHGSAFYICFSRCSTVKEEPLLRVTTSEEPRH